MSHNPSLAKQLFGAVVGGSLALALYYGYDYGAPKLQAWVTIPQIDEYSSERAHDPGIARVAESDRSDREYAHIAARNKEIAREFATREGNPEEFVIAQEDTGVVAPTKHTRPVSTTGTEYKPEEEIAFEDAAEEDYEDAEEEWEGFPWDALEEEYDDYEEDYIHADADDLPDSGFGLGFVTLGALAGAGALRGRRSTKSSMR